MGIVFCMDCWNEELELLEEWSSVVSALEGLMHRQSLDPIFKPAPTD